MKSTSFISAIIILLLVVFTDFVSAQDMVLSFGSCDNQNKENVLWKEIVKHKPDVWIWGGDVVYADTDKMKKLRKIYRKQTRSADYKQLVDSTIILGTWDDHDYGINDGGVEFPQKANSQDEFLNFLSVPKDDPRRIRKGVYHARNIENEKGSIKVIILDTRYHRSALTPSTLPKKRYQPNSDKDGTMLGDEQWSWLENELASDNADFTIIVSSIQVLSQEHGFETWGNMPHERSRLLTLIKNSAAKNVIFLSGDRHISEYSQIESANLSYPLIDFTSSGLTHSYTGFHGESNEFRRGEVISDLSFGILLFDFEKQEVRMQMRGKDNVLQQERVQVY